MKKNIGKADRIVRVIVGILLIYVASVIDNRFLIILASALGAISLVESYTGFCGIYEMFNIGTNKGGK